MEQSVQVKINDLLRIFRVEKIQKGLIIIFFLQKMMKPKTRRC